MVATHATRDFILFLNHVVVDIFVELCRIVVVGVLLARAAPCQGTIHLRKILGLFGRKRVWGRRLVR